jgi:hypothetical protein
VAADDAWVSRLVDDAAWFPPGNLPLDRAIPAHDDHLASDHGYLVGPLLLPDRELPTVASLTVGRAEPVVVRLVISGGAGAVEPALTLAERNPGLEVVGVETAARDDDLASAVRRVATIASSAPEEVMFWVELPPLDADVPTAGWLRGLDEIALAGYGFKYRTGGETADAYPSETQLAQVIDAALDREVVTKLTAGLHRAVRHRDPDDGFEHHGFLNVLAAFDAGRDGAGPADVADLLSVRDGAQLAARLQARGPQAAASARQSFIGFGSCSIDEPVADLRALGLMP